MIMQGPDVHCVDWISSTQTDLLAVKYMCKEWMKYKQALTNCPWYYRNKEYESAFHSSLMHDAFFSSSWTSDNN